MIKIFEAKPGCVKSLSFHPLQPWLLTGLHSGAIQLWNYRCMSLVNKFEEHGGPVRGLSFHQQQPIFVSGGDDYKVKVWDYKQGRCMFTLLGHLGYVRTTFFHNEYPWILSASDDRTIRIWNQQSQNCVAVIMSHNHTVMCAHFHPTKDLVVSASLDSTVRLWDISGLLKNNKAQALTSDEDQLDKKYARRNLDEFRYVTEKHVLKGHKSGVNWVAFHPTMPLILSAAGDSELKLWGYNDTKAWEVVKCNGHLSNVLCGVFHHKTDLMLSNSEDKTIRVWDCHEGFCLRTYRDDSKRFGVLTAHPALNLFAAGHDSGVVVFKIERERPAFAAYQNLIYHVKERSLHCLNSDNNKDIFLMQLRGNTVNRPFMLSYNPAVNSILLVTRNPLALKNSTVEYYQLPDARVMKSVEGTTYYGEYRRSFGLSAIWIARNRYAILDHTYAILIMNLKHEVMKAIYVSGCDEIFYAGPGLLMLRQANELLLYDVKQEKEVETVQASNVKQIIWSKSMTLGALVGNHCITVINKRLRVMYSSYETNKVKSGVWDGDSVFVYNTVNHIKYLVANGDRGIIRTLDIPLYITGIKLDALVCLGRDSQPKLVLFDRNSYHLKLGPKRGPNVEIEADEGYLKSYPEVAIHFAKNLQTRFNLALECGNWGVAVDVAGKLNDRPYWNALAEAAMARGNVKLAETGYFRAKNFEKLVFLHFIRGNKNMLENLMRIAEMLQDVSGQTLLALLLGDVRKRIRILQQNDCTTLAYINAAVHGLKSEESELTEQLLNSGSELPTLPEGADLLIPPPAVESCWESWPTMGVIKNLTEAQLNFGSYPSILSAIVPLVKYGESGVESWAADDDELIEKEEVNNKTADRGEGNLVQKNETEKFFSDLSHDRREDTAAPARGLPPNSHWVANSRVVLHHVFAGYFESAFRLLHDQIGVIDYEPFREHFMNSRSHLPWSNLSRMVSSFLYLVKDSKELRYESVIPPTCLKLSDLVAQLQACYQLVTAGKFSVAVSSFRSLMLRIPLLVVKSKQEIQDAQDLIEICRHYLVGLTMEQYRKEMPGKEMENQIRSAELALYIASCRLQSGHQLMALRMAISINLKLKNLKTCASLCHRLLELDPSSGEAEQARQVAAICEKEPRDKHPLEYDPFNPFTVCANSFMPIYHGEPKTTCPFCGAFYMPECAGSLCRICRVSEIGKPCVGLTFINSDPE